MTSASCIAREWTKALESSVALNDFCRERFGREPSLFVSMDPRDLPGRKDCPYIALLPMGKKCGVEAEDEEFSLSVFLGIEDGTRRHEGRVFEYRGAAMLEEEMNPLVLQALADSGEHSPDAVEYQLGPVDTAFWQLENLITVNVPRTLGI